MTDLDGRLMDLARIPAPEPPPVDALAARARRRRRRRRGVAAGFAAVVSVAAIGLAADLRGEEGREQRVVTGPAERGGGPVGPDVLYILERFSGSTENPSLVRVVDRRAGTSRKVELPIGPGDPDPAMLLRGNRLVFYRGGHAPADTRVWSVPVADLRQEPAPLGRARWFLAGPRPEQVWLIEGDGDNPSRSAELVQSDGHVLIPSAPLPEGFPSAGLGDGLVVATRGGLVRWFADGRQAVTLATEPVRVVASTADVVLWVPVRDAAELHITPLSTGEADRVVALPVSVGNGASTAGRFATALGSTAYIVDHHTGTTTEVDLPIGGVRWVPSWSEDGKRLYLGGNSEYGSPRLWVWTIDSGQLTELRLGLDGLVQLGVGS